jgi:hypothetical protein
VLAFEDTDEAFAALHLAALSWHFAARLIRSNSKFFPLVGSSVIV